MTINCPQCLSPQSVKHCRSRHGHQRYRCKVFGHTFGELDRRKASDDLKESALRHYAEGVGLRVTERLIRVSHNSVVNWVRQEIAGQALARIDAGELHFVQADALWSYIGEKLASVSGCSGLAIASVLRRAQLVLDGIDINLRLAPGGFAERDDADFMFILRIHDCDSDSGTQAQCDQVIAPCRRTGHLRKSRRCLRTHSTQQ